MKQNFSTGRWLMILAALCVFFSCNKGKGKSMSIAELKGSDWRSNIGKTVNVEGYLHLNADGSGMLVSELDLLQTNSVIPEENYIFFPAGFFEDLAADMYHNYGSKVILSGTVAENADAVAVDIATVLGDEHLAMLDPTGDIEHLDTPPDELNVPEYYNLCAMNPALCGSGTPTAGKYALLYSGGLNASNAHMRYWNDLAFMYRTLRSVYGFTDEQIIVVYKDGVAQNGDMPVDYAASETGIQSAFTYLQDNMVSTDNFFVFITNHGGGWNNATATNNGGMNDLNADEIDVQGYDEQLYLYNAAATVNDDYFADQFSFLSFNKMVGLFEPCFSGGFLYDFRGTNRVLISAANEFQPSWASNDATAYDEFSYHFTCALNGAKHDGTIINADYDGDGKVNMREAFSYAINNDDRPEQPLLEDNGDGVGTDFPSGVSGADGYLATGISLSDW